MSREEYFLCLLSENGWASFDILAWANGKDSVIHLTKHCLFLVRNVLDEPNAAFEKARGTREITSEQDEVRFERERPGGIDAIGQIYFSHDYVIKHGHPRVPPLSG